MKTSDLRPSMTFNAVRLTNKSEKIDLATDLWVLTKFDGDYIAGGDKSFESLTDDKTQRLGVFMINYGPDNTIGSHFTIRICDTGDLRFIVDGIRPGMDRHLFVRRLT